MRRLIETGLSALLIKGGGALIGFFASIIISRNLGASELGLYYLALSIITIPLTMSLFGLNITILRKISIYHASNNWAQINNIFTRATIKVAIISITTALLIYSLSDLISSKIYSSKNLSDVLKIIAFSIIPISLFNLHAHALQAIRKILVAMFFLGGMHNLLIIFATYLFSISNSKSASLSYLVSATIVAAIVTGYWFINKKSAFRVTDRKESLFKSSLSTLISQLLGQTYTQVVMMLLGVWSTASEVGYFAVSLKIAMLVSFVLMSVNRIVAPDFSSLYNNSEIKKLRSMVASSTKFMLVVSLPFVFVLMTFPSKILSLYGEEFITSANCLRILALGQLIYVMTGNVNILLQMTGNEKIVRDSALIGCVIALFTGIVLIPIYKINGAALTTLISLSLANLISSYRAYKTLNINTLKCW